jgi:hypothetical protein
VPVALKVTGLEFGITPFDTVTTETMVDGALQTPLGNRKYVTVPPAVVVAPLRLAESRAEFPTTMLDDDRLVVRVGASWVMVRLMIAE